MKTVQLKIDTQLFFINKPDEIASELISFFSEIKIDINRILKIEYHINISDKDEYSTTKESISTSLKHVYKNNIPAYIIIPQNPLNTNGKALLTFTLCDNPQCRVEHKEYQKMPYTVVINDNQKTIYSGGITFLSTEEFLLKVQKAFDFVEQLLDHEGMLLSNIIRQWNYIENILEDENFGGQNLKRYQIFNEVRSFYYDPSIFKQGIPVTTTTGCLSSGITTDFIATSYNEDIDTPILNIEPESASDINNINSSHFEYAKFVTFPGHDKIFISGIRTPEGKNYSLSDDIKEQAEQLINDIKSLIKPSTLKANGIKDVTGLNIETIKVYLKNISDFNIIDPLMTEQLPLHNKTYVAADICSNNLMEIEGIISFDYN